MSSRCLFALALTVALAPTVAHASERRFTYTYESSVLNPGDVELEIWNSVRAGRSSFYNRLEQRIEVEVGVAPGLQTALYLNTKAITKASGDDRVTEFEFAGFSSEWKFKLSDPVADSIGTALYLEGTLASAEAEVEAKLILDKRWDSVLLALNLVGEYELIFEHPETESEVVLEADVGLGYFLSSSVFAGVEIRSHTVFVGGETLSALYAGPTFSYSSEKWWIALSLLPQLPFKIAGGQDSGPELGDHERLNARLLLGIHI